MTQDARGQAGEARAAADADRPGAGRGKAARADAARAFLAASGWSAATLRPLAGDASPRRYWRLTGGPGGAGAVLMDADPAQGQDVGRFAATTEWLRALGLSAPELRAIDAAAGFLLLEDLGDALFARVCAGDRGAEGRLYAAAVEALLAIQAAPPPQTVAGWGCAHAPVAYDAAVLAREARLALTWRAPDLGPDAGAEFDALVAAATTRAARDRRVLVHLDYHAENLIWLPQRRGAARVGILDHQDARIGAAAYDPASLLRDARRDVTPRTAAAALAAYRAGQGGDFDADAFAADFAALSAQRNLKILGLFTRLAVQDGKPAYLRLLPRVWRNLTQDLAHPALAALRAFVTRRLSPPDGA